jgi:hypothetical protein
VVIFCLLHSRNSSVGEVTGYRLEDCNSISIEARTSIYVYQGELNQKVASYRLDDWQEKRIFIFDEQTCLNTVTICGRDGPG